jgi:hypothetical protein
MIRDAELAVATPLAAAVTALAAVVVAGEIESLESCGTSLSLRGRPSAPIELPIVEAIVEAGMANDDKDADRDDEEDI